MSVVNPRYLESDAVIGSPALAAETVVATLAGISTRGDGGGVALRGWLAVTLGTGATAVGLHIRRGTDTTGTSVVLVNGLTATAGDFVEYSISGLDTPGEISGESYVLTLSVTGATAASTVSHVSLSALF